MTMSEDASCTRNITETDPNVQSISESSNAVAVPPLEPLSDESEVAAPLVAASTSTVSPSPSLGSPTTSPPHSGNFQPTTRSPFVPSSLMADLVRAVQDESDDLCDVNLIAAGGALVPACRFVLAARSAVFRRMLYGSFREAKSSSIALLGYAEPILRAVVYYCHYDSLDPHFPTQLPEIQLQIQLTQAADYLQLPALQALMEQHILRHMAAQPGLVCTTVLNETAPGSALSQAALHMIECRPYVTLALSATTDDTDTRTMDRPGITALSAEKLETILKNTSIGCSEWFLLQQLSKWYQYQLEQLGSENTEETATETASTTSASHERLLTVTRELCQRYIRLAHIEPSILLSLSYPWVTQQAIFDAVAQQALSASQHGVWRLHYRGVGSNSAVKGTTTTDKQRVDRVLVEGSGSIDVDGMYYRIAQGCLSNDSDLYTKREVAVGQQYVYTLSRCLRYATAAAIGGWNDASATSESNAPTSVPSVPSSASPLVPYYECRIFGSKFLTHQAVQSLRTMQSTASIVPCFQPILQVLELTPPLVTPTSGSTSPPTSEPILATASSFDSGAALNAFSSLAVTTVPRPIRKYYRVRLSDGDHHMPGTLAPELNSLIESGELKEKRVLQVLEFGVYTIYGCTGIHVLKAVVVTATPSYVFGDPVPLEELEATSQSPHMDTARNGLQHLYKCSTVEEAATPTCRIPKTGWHVDAHGLSPAPECTWIPAPTPTTGPVPVVPSRSSSTTRWRGAATTSSSTASPRRGAGGTSPRGARVQF